MIWDQGCSFLSWPFVVEWLDNFPCFVTAVFPTKSQQLSFNISEGNKNAESLGYICLVIHASTLSTSMFAEASPISVQYQVTLSEKLCHSHQISYQANNWFGQPQMRCFASLTQIFQYEHKNCFCKPYFWWIAGYFIYILVALLSHFPKVKNDKWV